MSFERSEPIASCWRGSLHRPPPPRRTRSSSGSPRSRRACAHAGLRLGFHNHDAELRPLDDGRTVLDRLADLGDGLFFEVDLGWAWFAGVEPAGLVERLAPRVPLVHVKDLAPHAEQRFVPVGDGDVGYRELLPAIEGLGIEWLLVEQDETEGPPLDAVRRSFAVVADMVGSPV